MSLVILDHELARRPLRLVELALETYTGLAQTIGSRGDVVRLKVQVEVTAVIHERNRRIYFVDLLQMNDVPTRAHARVKVVVQKLEGKTELYRVEADRGREISRP